MLHRRCRLLVLFKCALFGFLIASPDGIRAQTVSHDTTALTEAQANIFWSSAEDAVPKLLGGVTKAQEGQHYVAGNEWNLHLYRDTLKDLGGGYVGVGSDQAYLFIGWQRPSLAWLMDYDPVVKSVHHVYHALFSASKSPSGFIDLWRRDRRAQALKAITTYYDKRLTIGQSAKRTWKKYRGRILKRLELLKSKLASMEPPVPTFLNDQATYDFIRAMIAARRVRPLVGNLLSYRGMSGIAKASEKLGVPTRVVYVSNAEQYWAYTKRYRKNMRRMFVDERTVLLRTLLTWKRNKDYRYIVQPWTNFLSWLQRDWVRRVDTIVPYRKDDSTHVDFVVVNRDVEAVEKRLRKKGRVQ